MYFQKLSYSDANQYIDFDLVPIRQKLFFGLITNNKLCLVYKIKENKKIFYTLRNFLSEKQSKIEFNFKIEYIYITISETLLFDIINNLTYKDNIYCKLNSITITKKATVAFNQKRLEFIKNHCKEKTHIVKIAGPFEFIFNDDGTLNLKNDYVFPLWNDSYAINFLKINNEIINKIKNNFLVEKYNHLIGKQVNVDINCYNYGFNYPEKNILSKIKDNILFFKDLGTNNEWTFKVLTKDDCVINLSEIKFD